MKLGYLLISIAIFFISCMTAPVSKTVETDHSNDRDIQVLIGNVYYINSDLKKESATPYSKDIDFLSHVDKYILKKVYTISSTDSPKNAKSFVDLENERLNEILKLQLDIFQQDYVSSKDVKIDVLHSKIYYLTLTNSKQIDSEVQVSVHLLSERNNNDGTVVAEIVNNSPKDIALNALLDKYALVIRNQVFEFDTLFMDSNYPSTVFSGTKVEFRLKERDGISNAVESIREMIEKSILDSNSISCRCSIRFLGKTFNLEPISNFSETGYWMIKQQIGLGIRIRN